VTRLRSAIVALLAAGLLIASIAPVAAQETGADTGDVTVRMVLKGPVDEADGFLVIIDCDDEWCHDETEDPSLPDGKIVIFCGPGVADAPTCSATTNEFTVALQAGPIEYWFYRIRDYQGDSENQLLHNGTGTIHSGSQTITMEYVYPSGTSGGGGAPTLPDTAVPAP
jgi:hypothetical protein